MVLLLYTIYWLVLSHVLSKAIVEAGEESGEDGIQLHYSDLDVSGYPHRLQVALDQLEVIDQRGAYELRLNVPNFEVTAHPWNLKHWVGVFGSPFQLGVKSLERELMVKIRNARTSLAVGRMERLGRVERLERFSLRLNEVGIHDGMGELSGTVDQFQLHFRELSHVKKEYDIGLLIRSLIVQGMSSIDPDPHLERLVLEAKLLGPVPTRWEPSSLHSWRTEGGVLHLQRLHFSWSGVDLELSGTLALDHLLRPIATGTATVEGYGEALSAMNKSGLIGEPVTIAATHALDLLSTTSHETGQRVVQVPITIQDGILSLGPVALLHVGALIAP